MNTAKIQTHNAVAKRTDSLNWDAIKLRYELVHETVPALACTYGLTPEFLQRVIDSEQWTQKKIPSVIDAVGDIDAEALQASMQSRVDVITLYKELAMLPTMLEAESMLVTQLKTAINSIKPTSRTAAADLKHLVQAYTSLAERQSILKVSEVGDKPVNVNMNIDVG